MAEIKTKYLVRPNDMHIFEVDESNGYYRSYSTRNVVYHDGGRPNASDHMTYENLTNNYNFFPIDELNLSMYEYFHNLYMGFIIWQNRPNGHGGIKGGTFEEWLIDTGRQDSK